MSKSTFQPYSSHRINNHKNKVTNTTDLKKALGKKIKPLNSGKIGRWAQAVLKSLGTVLHSLSPSGPPNR